MILADLQAWKRGRGIARNLRLSWFCLAAGSGAVLLLAASLAIAGWLNAFIQYYLDFVPAHAATGGVPIPLGGYSAKMPLYVLQLAIALAGQVGIVLYFGHMFYRGERPSDRDVVVGSLAVVGFLYFPQYLSRADGGHLAFSFLVIFPVALYLAVRLLSSVKVAQGFRVSQGMQWLAIAFVAVVAVSVTLEPGMHKVGFLSYPNPSTNMRQIVSFPPTDPGIGYQTSPSSTLGQTAHDLAPFVSRYVGKDQWLFDFTNSPGLFYYLLNIHPKTRFYNVSLAYTAATQQALVDQLQQYQPSVVAFNDLFFGEPRWDYISNEVREYLVSRYILANYQPLTEIDSYSFFIRKGVPVPPLPVGGFHSQFTPVVQDASQLYWGPKCSWGSALNYLTSDQPSAGSPQVGVLTDGSTDVTALDGWAFDTTTSLGASQVFAVQGGSVVSVANADLRRPIEWSPFGDIGSKFSAFSLPLERTSAGPMSVVALNWEGGATVLSGSKSMPSGSYVPGTSYRVSGNSIVGAVTGSTRLTEQVISTPQGNAWARYDWLAVRLGSRQALDRVTVSDGNAVQPLGTDPYLGPSHVMTFDALPGPAKTFYVPVASCPQWFGYGSAPLTVTADAAAGSPAISLIG